MHQLNLHRWFLLPNFLMFFLPFSQLCLIFKFEFGIIVVNPQFINNDHSLTIPVILILKFLQFSFANWKWSPIYSGVSQRRTHMEHTHFILSSYVSTWFTDIFDMFKRLANVLLDKCRSSLMMEAMVLVLISVTKVLGLPHRGALWTDFRPSLNYLCHFLMLKLLKTFVSKNLL